MAQAEAKAARTGTEPSAAMREVMAIDAKLRAGKPEPKTIPDERALRAGICGYWVEGAPVMHQTADVNVPGEAGPVRARVYRPTANEAAPMVLLIHGGGWAFGSIEETEPLARHLAADLKCSFVPCPQIFAQRDEVNVVVQIGVAFRPREIAKIAPAKMPVVFFDRAFAAHSAHLKRRLRWTRAIAFIGFVGIQTRQPALHPHCRNTEHAIFGKDLRPVAFFDQQRSHGLCRCHVFGIKRDAE